MDKTTSVARIVADIISLIFVFVPVLVINVVAQPHHRGFICVNGHVDPRISLPFDSSTISNGTATAAVIVIAAVVIFGGEILHYSKYKSLFPAYHVGGSSRAIHPILWHGYSAVGYFAYGMGVTLLITEIGKHAVGRLRPHFGSVCQPNLAAYPNCDGLYIDIYQCGTNYTASQIKDSRMSFPSGHSSTTSFCAVFLSVYIHSHVRQLRGLMQAFIQVLLIVFAFFTGMSRIMDNQHHPTDVLAGYIIGITAGIWAVMHNTHPLGESPDGSCWFGSSCNVVVVVVVVDPAVHSRSQRKWTAVKQRHQPNGIHVNVIETAMPISS